MKTQLEKRLAELKSEFEAGREMLADLDRKRAELEATLLRISAAMHVIEEMLRQASPFEEEKVKRDLSQKEQHLV